ncbi:MAG: hypothetical protein V1662_00610 [Candidatus Omnitrophota bacterium]
MVAIPESQGSRALGAEVELERFRRCIHPLKGFDVQGEKCGNIGVRPAAAGFLRDMVDWQWFSAVKVLCGVSRRQLE